MTSIYFTQIVSVWRIGIDCYMEIKIETTNRQLMSVGQYYNIVKINQEELQFAV